MVAAPVLFRSPWCLMLSWPFCIGVRIVAGVTGESPVAAAVRCCYARSGAGVAGLVLWCWCGRPGALVLVRPALLQGPSVPVVRRVTYDSGSERAGQPCLRLRADECAGAGGDWAAATGDSPAAPVTPGWRRYVPRGLSVCRWRVKVDGYSCLAVPEGWTGQLPPAGPSPATSWWCGLALSFWAAMFW